VSESSKRSKTVSKPHHAHSSVSELALRFDSFVWRLSLVSASRFIWSFICEYFLNTCASL